MKGFEAVPAHPGDGALVHDETINDRVEAWTTLTRIVDNEPARSA
ncbi:hypothetical protein AB0H73_08165 [Streptomyces olivoreticuli]